MKKRRGAEDAAAESFAKQRAEQKPFEPGDVVQLKSGGPMMTVSESPDSYYVKCSWFGPDNRIIVQPLAIVCLKRADRSPHEIFEGLRRSHTPG